MLYDLNECRIVKPSSKYFVGIILYVDNAENINENLG